MADLSTDGIFVVQIFLNRFCFCWRFNYKQFHGALTNTTKAYSGANCGKKWKLSFLSCHYCSLFSKSTPRRTKRNVTCDVSSVARNYFPACFSAACFFECRRRSASSLFLLRHFSSEMAILVRAIRFFIFFDAEKLSGTILARSGSIASAVYPDFPGVFADVAFKFKEGE